MASQLNKFILLLFLLVSLYTYFAQSASDGGLVFGEENINPEMQQTHVSNLQ